MLIHLPESVGGFLVVVGRFVVVVGRFVVVVGRFVVEVVVVMGVVAAGHQV